MLALAVAADDDELALDEEGLALPDRMAAAFGLCVSQCSTYLDRGIFAEQISQSIVSSPMVSYSISGWYFCWICPAGWAEVLGIWE